MSKPRRSAAARLLLLAIPYGLAGCGAEAYQSRIEVNSVPFFGYQRELDSGLGSRWRKGDVSIRLPGEFKEVPAPKPKKKGETSAAPGRDPRLPPGFDIELPGLLGGFRGTMKAVTTGGKSTDVPVYAYVLSNRYLLVSKEPTAKPQAFDTTLVGTIGAGLGKGPVAALKQHPLVGQLAPGQEAFAPVHRVDRTSVETAISGVPMKYDIYVRREPPLQAAVLFVLPKEAARDMQKRIDLSLQTFRIETASAGGFAPAATPRQGASNAPGF